MGNMSSSVRKSEVVYKVERKPDETTYSWHGQKHYIPSENTKQPLSPSDVPNDITCPFCAGVLSDNGYEGGPQGTPDLHRVPSFSQSASAKIKVYHEKRDGSNPSNTTPPNYNVTSFEDEQTASFKDKRSFFEQFQKDESSLGNKSSKWSDEAVPGSDKKSSIPNGDHYDLFPNLRQTDRSSFRTSNASCSYVGGSTPGGVSLNESSAENSSSYDENSEVNFDLENSNWKEENLCEKHKHLRDWFRSGIYRESIAGFRKEIESLITKKDSGVYSPNESFESDPKTSSQIQSPVFDYNQISSRDSGLRTSVFASPSADNEYQFNTWSAENTTSKTPSVKENIHEQLFDEIMGELEKEDLEDTFGRFEKTYNEMCASSKSKNLKRQLSFEEEITPDIVACGNMASPASQKNDNQLSVVQQSSGDTWNPESMMEQILESAGNESDDFQDLLMYHAHSVGRPVNRAEVSCKMTSEVGVGGKAFVKTKSKKVDVETRNFQPNSTDAENGNVRNVTLDNAIPSTSKDYDNNPQVTKTMNDNERRNSYEKECELLEFYRKVMNEENEKLQKMLNDERSKSPTPQKDILTELNSMEPNNNSVESEADLQNYINIALASIHTAKEKIQNEIETATKEKEEMSNRNKNRNISNTGSLPHSGTKKVSPFEVPLRKSISTENTTAAYYELDPLHPDNVDLLIATLTEPVESKPKKVPPKVPPKGFGTNVKETLIEQEAPPPVSQIIRNFECNAPRVKLRKLEPVKLTKDKPPPVPPKPTDKPTVPPKPIKIATFKTPLHEKQNITHERTEVIYEGEQARNFLRRSSSLSTVSSSELSRPSREVTPEIADSVSYHRSTSHPSPDELDSVSRSINKNLSPIAEKENIKIDADKTLKRRKLRKPRLATAKPSNKVIKDVALFKKVIKPHNPKDGELVSEEISTEEVVIVLKYPRSLFIPTDENIYRDIIHHRVTKIRGPENQDGTLAIEAPPKDKIPETEEPSGEKEEKQKSEPKKKSTKTFSC